MVQNLRGYFILYVITIKWIECVLVKTEHSSMSKRPRLRSRRILGSLLLAAKMKQQLNIAKKVLRVGKNLASGCLWVAFATPCHPMAMALEGGGSKLAEVGRHSLSIWMTPSNLCIVDALILLVTILVLLVGNL